MTKNQCSALEKMYLGSFEVEQDPGENPKMIIYKTSADEIQYSFNVESLRNRSSLVHPHLLSLERFSVNKEKVEFFRLLSYAYILKKIITFFLILILFFLLLREYPI